MANKKIVRKKREPDARKLQAVVKAATLLFLKQGYSHTSMDAIAERAHVTKQTVYAYFHDKETLFTTMLTELCRRYVPIASIPVDGKKSFETMLYEIGLGYINLISGPDGLNATRLIMSEAPQHPKLAKLFYEGSTERMTIWLAEFLEAQNARGTTNIPNCMSAASYFFSLLKGRYHLRMSLCIKPVPTEAEKLAHLKENVAIFMHLYGGKKPLHTRSVL